MKVYDLQSKKGTHIVVLNPANQPITVNELGQTLGGRCVGKVSVKDSVVNRALDRRVLLLIS